ncbi:hypothetical protein ACHAXT_003844 [Thalassiosira profunda]
MEGNGDASAGVYLYEGQPDVPKDVTHVRFHPSVREIPEGAFTECIQLKTVELNDGLEVIGNSAFYSCWRMNSFTFPSTVRQIGDSAFEGCHFENLVLPPLIESIGKKAFFGCEGLRSVELNDGLKTISDSAFGYCWQLRSISFPSTLESIGEMAFFRTGLQEVVLKEGLKVVDCGAFAECSLESIRMPSTVDEIGGSAFKDCCDLKSVALASGLKHIDYDAFKGCTSLARICLPPTIELLGMGAFEGCTGLRSAELVEDATCRREKILIEEDAFAGCISLMSFRLPVNVKRRGIRRGAFHSCPHLRNVILTSSQMGHASFNRAFTSLYFIDYAFDDLLERFNGMPIHELCHYRSNVPTDRDSLQRVVDEKSLSYMHQDCLGMTPLHILACSCNSDLDLYKIVVRKFPSYLVTKDKWGKEPLYYALVGEAPLDILQFLFGAHRDVWGGLPFDFADMVKQLLNSKETTVDFMHRLFEAQRSAFPDMVLNLESIIVGDDMARRVNEAERMKVLVGSYIDLTWTVLIASFSERIRLNESLPPITETLEKGGAIIRSCGALWASSVKDMLKYADRIWSSMAKCPPGQFVLKRGDRQAFLAFNDRFKYESSSDEDDEPVASFASDPNLAWEQIVDNLSFVTYYGCIKTAISIFQALVRTSLAHRLEHIQHREAVEAMIAATPNHWLETEEFMTEDVDYERVQRALRSHAQSIRSKVRLFELHEAAGILELALWKTQIRNLAVDRATCRVRCGADIVVPGALAYLKD